MWGVCGLLMVGCSNRVRSGAGRGAPDRSVEGGSYEGYVVPRSILVPASPLHFRPF